jgi:hypothetical protein
MTSPLFLKVLVLQDSHESHWILDAIVFARERGISMVTSPAHCTCSLQPLYVAVTVSFKSKYDVAQNDWMMSNPG